IKPSKNLLSLPDQKKTLNGVTVTVINGLLTVNGTCSLEGSIEIATDDDFFLEKGNRYTLSNYHTGGGRDGDIGFGMVNTETGESMGYLSQSLMPMSFTYTANGR